MNERWRSIAALSSKCLRPTLGCTLLLLTSVALGCDTDADCGAGGTCIKREKRASGVCYGGAPRGTSPVVDGAAASPAPVTGELRERAKYWLGDPEALIKEKLPGKDVGGVCMVTQDCPAEFECVIAGFEGHCVRM